MFRRRLFCNLMLITVFVCVAGQTKPDILKSPSPKNMKRAETFTNVFIKTVQNSPELLHVFDTSVPASEISVNIFQTFHEAMQKLCAQYPLSLAKSLADAMYLSLPFMPTEAYTLAIASSMGVYLLSQEILTVNSSASYAHDFAVAILNNYPKANDVSNLTLSRALSYGIVDFLTPQGTTVVEHVPALVMNAARTFFAFGHANKLPLNVSVVAPPDTILRANRIYGVFAFTKSFLNAVQSSAALQSVFYSLEPVSVVSKAWQIAVDLFCNSIDCYDSKVYIIQTFVSDTYNNMSKSTYVKEIAEAFSILMIGMGTLTPDNAELESKKLAASIENLVNNLPPDADLQSRLGTILEAFRSLVGADHDIRSLFPVFFQYMIMGFYSTCCNLLSQLLPRLKRNI